MNRPSNLRLVAACAVAAWLGTVAGSCATDSPSDDGESGAALDGSVDASLDASMAGDIDASEPSDPMPGLLDASVGAVSDAGFVSIDFGLLPSPAVATEAGYSNLQALADAEVVSLGGGAVSFNVRWDELSEGANHDDLVTSFPALDAWQRRLVPFARNQRVSLAVSIAERRERAAPFPSSTPWDDPVVLSRAQQLVDRLYARLGEQVSLLSLGRDLDRYLAGVDQAEADAFRDFAVELLDYARSHPSRPPGLRLGVLATLEGWQDPSPQLQALGDAADARVISFYPMEATFEAVDPELAADNFASGVRELGARGARNLVVHEVAYPSAIEAGSSEAQQAAFYDALFNRLLKLDAQVSMLGVRALHDGVASECEREAATFGQPSDSPLSAWLCSTGVKTIDSRNKAAFRSVLRALATFHGE